MSLSIPFNAFPLKNAGHSKDVRYHSYFLIQTYASYKLSNGCEEPWEGGKVDMPDLITYPKQTPINEWCVVKRGPKKGHQKDMRFKQDLVSSFK